MQELWDSKASNGLIHFLSMYDEWKLDKVALNISYLGSTSNAALVAAGVQGQLNYAWDRNGLPGAAAPLIDGYESERTRPISFGMGAMNYPIKTFIYPRGYNESQTWMVSDAGVPKGEAPDLLYFDPTILLNVGTAPFTTAEDIDYAVLLDFTYTISFRGLRRSLYLGGEEAFKNFGTITLESRQKDETVIIQ